MWLKVDDGLIDHPKMFAAGRHLGRRGRARAFCVYMASLSWVNRHLTDGFIPDEAVASLTIDEHPRDVADVLALENVRLFHRENVGFRIHDYHDHNPKSDAVKEKLSRDRARKREERQGVRVDSARNPHGVRPDSCALARARSRSQPLSTSTRTVAVATGTRPKKTATHRILCAMVRAERQADPGGTFSDWVEGVKQRLVAQGFGYPPGDRLDVAFKSVA